MYKSQLLELCMAQRWPTPVFSETREGPDHVPLFRATVAVNGQVFNSPDEGVPSVKDAQNLAAKAAFLNLAATSKPFVSQTSCKTQLSVYAQKRGKVLPLYRHSQEGPSHAPQFMAEVTIDGQTFQSQDYYRTLRDAEAAAAAVALNSLPPIPPQQSSFRSYKNLLQEMAQKQAIPLPVYNTTTYNSDYSAAFKSSVLFKGKTFDGEPGTKKKQAEMNAAKVAYQYFEEVSQK